MNERIRELAEQARESATTRHPASNITLSVNSELFEQKFAELIIKETLQVARAGIEYGDGMENAVYHYFEIGMSTEDKKTLIKELLGVKNETN